MKIPTRWLTALAAVAMAGTAQAQTTVNMSSSITIPAVLYLNATSGGGAISFASPAYTDFNTGYIASTTTTTLAYAANVRHSITIWTAAANMSNTGNVLATDPAATKATADLKWSTDGTTYTGIVASSGTAPSSPNVSAGKIVTQEARGNYTSTPVSVTYRMALSYANDTPSTYTLSFYYTIIAD